MVTLADFENQWGWLLTSVWAIGAANDLGIAGTLVYLIYMQRSNVLPKRLLLPFIVNDIDHEFLHRFSSTVAVVDKLMLWTIG